MGLHIEDLDIEARSVDLDETTEPATGPVVQVATGEVNGARFHLAVYRAAAGVCLSFDWENSAGTSCGAEPGGAPFSDAFGVMSLGGDGVTQEVVGVAGSEVDAVWIELESGERASAILLPLDAARIEANAFAAFLAMDAVPVAVLALDEGGEVIERFELGPRVP